jgi:hypothetical protein
LLVFLRVPGAKKFRGGFCFGNWLFGGVGGSLGREHHVMAVLLAMTQDFGDVFSVRGLRGQGA